MTTDDQARLSDADRCRANGWTAGTCLVGDEGYGPTVIQLTAIGERKILAKTISHNDNPHSLLDDAWNEGQWTLRHRDWREVETPVSQILCDYIEATPRAVKKAQAHG